MATKSGAAASKAASGATRSRSRKATTAQKSRTQKAGSTNYSADELLKYYRDMLLIRRFEEKAGQMYGMGLIGGFCHLYIGQEAVVTGIQASMQESDSVVASYRCHGHMLACGMDAKGVMAELTGRRGGYSKGKGGSMHMFSREKNFFGGHGIVGAQVPIGTGIAFAQKYLGENSVHFCYLGDGAVNQGQVYESFNMAALWKIPIVYVIENNRYGMGTSVQRASASTELYKRGMAYGIPGVQADGMDVIKVRDVAREVIQKVRGGAGPYILEVMTYRYRGHSMSDPAKYRSREEVQKMRSEHDPIDQLKKLILDNKLGEEDALKKIDREVKDIVSDAAEFAQNSQEPDPSELYTDVYAAPL
ncbi:MULTISPECIES: pyruvate dehydrogenase (acetyl-transferring) E1 component subunit alpha [Limibacillus]|jgi:pyruvate dehydrogenase E1 component alpha subunit|uniref:Pyruvate dehydrogenase E1 component subunit alpha n=1 Tax=Limibacillus halophilus TaxID=1579333 RepID=A0A839SW44_9PROT|nr:pyruvate dehydrogenase (acetyl-transferring) E1 component subunit alpha [Limibacillus halophilus]MBB3065910.1 pyruvate dehydrogenase E1 component alpha subunit [Limibacillus halophilus]